MKRVLFSVIFFTFIAFAFAKVPVYIMAGQSNMDGRANISEMSQIIKFWKQNGGADNIFMSYCNGDKQSELGVFRPYVPTSDRDTINLCGFDALLYAKLIADSKNPVYIIKESKGGTAIDTISSSNSNFYWYPYHEWTSNPYFSQKSLLLQLEQNIDACIDNTLSSLDEGYEIKCIIWHQGESDRSYPDSYHDNLKFLVNRLRNHIAKKTGNYAYLNLPFIIGGINSHSKQFNSTIEEAKKCLASEDPNSHYINLDGCELRSDDSLHFNAEGCQEVSERIYRCLHSLGIL